jgi:hypothetical protein
LAIFEILCITTKTWTQWKFGTRTVYTPKKLNFLWKSIFGRKIEFFVKIEFSIKNRVLIEKLNFCEKSNFWSKIEFWSKNFDSFCSSHLAINNCYNVHSMKILKIDFSVENSKKCVYYNENMNVKTKNAPFFINFPTI